MFHSKHTDSGNELPHDLEARTQEIGRELLRESRDSASRRFRSDRLMTWVMQDAVFRTQLFRFVDVFPVLKTPHAVRQHLGEYLQQPGVKLPAGMSLAIAAGGLFGNTFARTISGQIEAMGRSFIAGRDVAEAMPQLCKRWDDGVAFSVDLLGEACLSHPEADAYRQRYAQLLTQLPELTNDWPARPTLESDHVGPLPRCSISIKVSSLHPNISVVDFAGSVERLFKSVAPLLELARDRNVLTYFDMEQRELKDITFFLFRKCCEAIDFPAGIALQAYLRSADEDAQSLIDWSRQAKRTVWVRLIKGSYWDYENIHAELMNWPPPVWQAKQQTDACFERLTRLFLRQTPKASGEPGAKLALGTHNVRSVAHALALLEQETLPRSALEFQVLRGMADELTQALVARGLRVRQYVPVGEMIPGMAYLVRRLLENTSNEGFVRNSRLHEKDEAQLLAPPIASPTIPPTSYGFASEPRRDFADAPSREAFAAAVASTPLPDRPAELTVEDARRAVDIASGAFADWRKRSPQERAQCLTNAAARLRSQRDRLSAIMVREALKTWSEADADICEAIDFCEYYASQAIGLLSPQGLTQLAGERNELLHEPRGIAVVIAPWNFPIAIPTGMTVAALVTGNPTILKPAEQTPLIARELCEALWQAGIPRDVLHYLPGEGQTVGRSLVGDPRVAVIAFTGSSAVGLQILSDTAPNPANPTLPIKHVVCEMGGKNAIIVDASADIDEAVMGVRTSAFSYSGQKCSACSRVIVLAEVHDLFVRRLVEASRALRVGDARDPATDIGPLIDDAAADKVHRYIQIGRSEARLLTRSDSPPAGRLIAPHIFVDVPPNARIATDEIFGPVLCIIRASGFAEALEIANSSAHKLTGGVYSRTPSHLQLARRELLVGNLYLNRNITGAVVGRQPFGGFGLSGLGTQAGGPEYLLHFLNPRVVTENTLRRGFAPPAAPRPSKGT